MTKKTSKEMWSFSGRIRSMGHAVRGVGIMLRSQCNAWVHLAATIAVVGVGLLIGISTAVWGLIVLAIVSVWTAEGLNTAIELLTDIVSPDFHPIAKKGKDVAAGAVLITAIGAVIIGIMVFGPYLSKLCGCTAG